MVKALPVSVVIVARNEAANLPRCLASVRGWTAEIVVVLNATTDASESLALAAGARVHHLPWQGFRDTKNAALALATQPWALCLDADEEEASAWRAQFAREPLEGPLAQRLLPHRRLAAWLVAAAAL